MQIPPPSLRKAETEPRLRPTLGLIPLIAVSAAIAGQATAQAVDAELEAIVVEDRSDGETATGYTVSESASGKATAPLVDTPKSVTVITRKEMQERGATTLKDVLRTTPGITLRAGEGGVPAGDIPQIRGFDASNDILVDGIRNSSRTSYESFNLESIEITKGPDGSANGAGAEGGTINLNTKVPQPGRFDDVSLSYGTGNYKRVTLDSNREFGAFGARLNLMYQDADDLGGKKGKTSKRIGAAPSFSYTLDNGSKITAGLYYFKNEDMPDYGVRMSGDDAPDAYRVGSGTPGDPWQPIDVPTDTFYGTPGRDFSDNVSKSGYLRFDHDFSDTLRFSATVRKNYDQTKYLVTQPALASDGTITRGSKSTNRDNEAISFNAQISGEGELWGMNHRFAVGVDIAKSEAVARDGFTFDPAPGNVSYVDPDLGHWNGTITEGAANQWHTTKTRTLYALDTVEISPQWEASFGLSFNSYDVESTTSTGTESTTSDMTNGSIGLVYKPRENGRIYAAFSTSSKPGGLGAGTGGENASSSLDDLDPERTKSYEIGTKWLLFDDQLMLSAALFRTEKTNARITNALGEVENVGETRAQGIELGFAGQINEKWGISGGYVYQDVELVDGGYTTPRGGGTPYPNPGNGKQLLKIPRNSFSLWTTYEYSDALTLGLGATYVDERVASYATDGSVVAIVPSSWQVDVMAAYQITEDTALQLNINNLFDEHVYGDSHVTQHVYSEPGRNFILTLNHTF